MNKKEIFKRFGPALETGRYAEKAERYCINKFGSVDGNETIFAAVLISQAICSNSIELMDALDQFHEKLDQLNEKLGELDIRSYLADIEEAIMKVEAGVADVAAR